MADTETAPSPKAPASKTEKISVTMSDNRVVEFNKKQKLVKTSDPEKGEVRLDFVNGETRLFTIPDSLRARFAVHGAEQKLGDAIAGETDIGDAIAAVDDLLGRLNKGEWLAARAAGSFTGISVLIQALMEASGKPVDEIKAYLSNRSQAEKIALRRSDKLRPIVERLEAEKASKSKTQVDTDSMLADLGVVKAAPKAAKA